MIDIRKLRLGIDSMSTAKHDMTSLQQPRETVQQKYDLDKEVEGYLNWAKNLVAETAGTAGLNVANEQVKTFLIQYIPAVIINVTNLYGPELGGRLISRIQMAIISTATGGLGFNSIMDPVIQTMAEGTMALLGLPVDEHAYQHICKFLEKPISTYARHLGYSAYIPTILSWTPFTGQVGEAAAQVNQAMLQPRKIHDAYLKAQAIYMTPFTELSTWMATHYTQLMLNSIRDPYLQSTFIPGLEKLVDDMLPKRDVTSNLDPLGTQEEHAYDVGKQSLQRVANQYRRVKQTNILTSFFFEVVEDVLSDPELQTVAAARIAGDTGRAAVQGTHKAYDLISDEHSLSRIISEWMQGNFDALVQMVPDDKRNAVNKHAELFKLAFSGTVLTSEQIDTIKGKWWFTKVVESLVKMGYEAAASTIVAQANAKITHEVLQIRNAIETRDSATLLSLLNSPDPEVCLSMRYVILTDRLNFKSKNSGLPVSPLMYAIELGDLQSVKVMVENCSVQSGGFRGQEQLDVDLDQYSAGITPLHLAIMQGRNDIARYLIDKGANRTKPSILGKATPLMIAAKYGNLEILDYLLQSEQVAQDLDETGFRNRTALHYAMMGGHSAAAAHLIHKGAHLFAKDLNGVSPLGLYFKQLMVHVGKGELTQQDAEVNFERFLQELKPVIQQKIDQLLVTSEDYPVVKDYLKLAINIGCKLPENTRMPLFKVLLEHNEIKFITQLLHDPDNARLIERELVAELSGDAHSAASFLLSTLSQFNSVELSSKLISLSSKNVIDIFLKKLILPKTRNTNFPFLPLEYINQSVIEAIINREDFNRLKQRVQLAILNHQIKNGHADLVKLILRKNPALLNQQDALLNTPLHYSIKFGRYELTRYLLDQSADIRLKNKNGHTAYENWGGTSFASRVLGFGPLRNWRRKQSGNDELAKVFAGNLMNIRKQINDLNRQIEQSPENRKQIIYDTLSRLIKQNSKDEVRNGVISELLQRPDCDLDVFSMHKNTGESLVLQAVLNNEHDLLDAFIKNLLGKYPDAPEAICRGLMDELLLAPVSVSEQQIIEAMKVLLNVHENKSNALLSIRDDQFRLPSEVAFLNKRYVLMEFLLSREPANVSLDMMDYILINNLSCFQTVFDTNQEAIGDYILRGDPHNVARHLNVVWNKTRSDESGANLFMVYFLNASGAAINQFLEIGKNEWRTYTTAVTVEELFSKFNKESLYRFIETKFAALSQARQMKLLELSINKNDMDAVYRIVDSNPGLLNVQLPEFGNRTPMHMAVSNHNWAMANYFMIKGAVVNVQNKNGHTAYDNWYGAHAGSLLSTKASRWDITKLNRILRTGSEPEQNAARERIEGNRLIMRHFHVQEIAQMMRGDLSREKKIQIIAERIQIILSEPKEVVHRGMSMEDYLQATRNLITDLSIDHEITVNELFSYKFPDAKGDTLLHQAIRNNKAEIISFILDYPVNLDIQNNEGETPLHLAVDLDHLELSEKLINKGASAEIPNNQNKTVMQLIEDASHIKRSGLGMFNKAPGAISSHAASLLESIKVKILERLNVPDDELPGQDHLKKEPAALRIAQALAQNPEGDITVHNKFSRK